MKKYLSLLGLLGILLSIFLITTSCGGGNGESGISEAHAMGANAIYVGNCMDQAVYCWSVMGDHTPDMEIWLNPGVHVETRVKLHGEDKWYWCRNIGVYAIGLFDEPYTPFDNDTVVYKDIHEYVDYLEWFHNFERFNNYGIRNTSE